jgi:hypothetical protein
MAPNKRIACLIACSGVAGGWMLREKLSPREADVVAVAAKEESPTQNNGSPILLSTIEVFAEGPRGPLKLIVPASSELAGMEFKYVDKQFEFPEKMVLPSLTWAPRKR